ncbi:unnamed protein product [Lactuca virosa]|uniref:FAS1 domain-containing protein n=1 Tax=Lactuca virosa TaxID=75947 RepID=A0AAU9NR58_9ASTR|nr:unnamed protein product [Lactuca virosa]
MALSPVLSCFLLWSLVSTATAFDITKILNQYTDYTVFNQELSRTGVAEEINMRTSVTVLVISNGAMSAVTSQKEGSIADIMRIHVVLDYYDSAKIKTLKNETTLTTLYQTTGSADKEQGFITVNKENNEIKLGSAVSGSQMSARVNKVVTSVPYDISVIEISSPIIPNGIDASDPPSQSSPSPSPDQSYSTPLHPPSSSPSDSPADSSSDHSSSANTTAPASAPSNESKQKPIYGQAPAVPSPSDADVDADDDDADAPSDKASSSSRKAIVSGIMLLASFVASL